MLTSLQHLEDRARARDKIDGEERGEFAEWVHGEEVEKVRCIIHFFYFVHRVSYTAKAFSLGGYRHGVTRPEIWSC